MPVEYSVGQKTKIVPANIVKFAYIYNDDLDNKVDKYRIYFIPSKEDGNTVVYRYIHPNGTEPVDFEEGISIQGIIGIANELDGGEHLSDILYAISAEW